MYRTGCGRNNKPAGTVPAKGETMKKFALAFALLILVGCEGPKVELPPEEENNITLKRCVPVAGVAGDFKLYSCPVQDDVIYCGYRYAGYGPTLSCTQ
jgi:hypothetical protein